MNKKEYDKLIELKSGQIPVVQIFNLNNKADRTLLYGYTCDKDTFHVYIKNMKIHIITPIVAQIIPNNSIAFSDNKSFNATPTPTPRHKPTTPLLITRSFCLLVLLLTEFLFIL